MAIEIVTRAEARAQDLKRFYTATACRRGHLSERFVDDGGCVACKYERNALWVRNNQEKKRASVVRWRAENIEYVKATQKAYHTEWYKTNKSTADLKNKAYARAHPEAARKATKKWREKNLERVKEYSREWEKANPEKRSALSKRKYEARPEHYKAKNAKWARDNPEKKTVVDQRRRARENGASGTHTAADLADILRMQKHRCAHPGCGADLRKVGKHLDHIIPLALGGSNARRNLRQYYISHTQTGRGAL